MADLPRAFGAYLHGFSVVSVPVVMLAVGAWEHPFFVIMMLPAAAIAAIVHGIAAVSALRALRTGTRGEGARTISAMTVAAAPIGAVWAWIGLETFPLVWWAAALAVALLHLAWFIDTRGGAAAAGDA